jgi:hypothetical protein
MFKLDYIRSLATRLLKGPVALAAVLLASSCAFGQITMSLSGGSGAPGTGVVLNLSMSDPNSALPASLQWVMTYSTTDFSNINVAVGSAGTAAGKTISCNNFGGTSTCVLFGINETPIASGVVATVTLTVAASTLDTSSSVQLTSGMGSSGLGGTITSANSGSTVTIVQPTPSLSGVSCAPTTVIGGQSSTCTVLLSAVVTSGTFTATLLSNSTLVTVPASVTVSASSNSATFTATTIATATTTGVTIKATNGAANVTTILNVTTPCTYTLTPGTRSFGVGGGSTTVVVAVATGCAWTATTDSPLWISLQSGGVSGNGNGSFVYSTGINLAIARLGTITVGNASFKVMEGGSTSVQPFTDVLPTDPYFDYISLMSNYGITLGCLASPPLYCPASPVTRAEMATFLVRAYDVSTGLPLTFPATPYFQDLPASGIPDSIYFDFVQRLAQLGITLGCQASPPLFCPDQSVTQGQMAAFMIRSWMLLNNITVLSYPPTPLTDVPATDQYFSFVQKMVQLGFWTGCGGGSYCENSNVTRDQMAPMVMRAMMGAP